MLRDWLRNELLVGQQRILFHQLPVGRQCLGGARCVKCLRVLIEQLLEDLGGGRFGLFGIIPPS